MAAIESSGPRSTRVPGVNQPGAQAPRWDPNNPYGVSEQPRPERPTYQRPDLPGAPDMSALYEYLTQRMGLDAEGARFLLQRAQREYQQGKAVENPILARMQAFTEGTGGYDPGSARAYGMGGQNLAMRDVARNRDAAAARIRALGIKGGEADLAQAGLEAQAAGQAGDIYSQALANAEQGLMGWAQGAKGFQPGPDSGSAALMDASQRGLYGQESQNALQEAGMANQFGLNLYGTDMDARNADLNRLYGANQALRSDETQRYGIDTNYRLGLKQIEANKPKKKSFLGGLISTLGGIAANLLKPTYNPFPGTTYGNSYGPQQE